MAEEMIEGNLFDQDFRDKLNEEAEKRGVVKPFNRKRDEKE